MATKLPVSTVPKFSKEKSFSMYKRDVKMWQFCTDVDKKKQATLLILVGLANDDAIREQVFDNCSEEDLEKESGVETLLEYLDKMYGKDDLSDMLEKYKDFRDYKKGNSESIHDYISNFVQKHNRIVKLGIKLPNEVLAFELIHNANISKEEEKLVLTGLNFDDKVRLFDEAQKSLKKFCGGSYGVAAGSRDAAGRVSDDIQIKTEPVFAASMTRGFRGGYRGRGNGRGNPYQGATRGGYGNRGVPAYGRNDFDQRDSSRATGAVPPRGASRGGPWKSNRPVNRSGVDGEPLRCHACGSYRHLLNECPDRYEVKPGTTTKNVFLSEVGDLMGDVRYGNSGGYPGTTMIASGDRTDVVNQFENIVMFTGYNDNTLKQLCVEAQNSAVVDTACASTVCGKGWFENYYNSLNDSDKSEVVFQSADRIFRFGGGPPLHSKSHVILPAQIDGVDIKLRTDVVDCEIPLLLSKKVITELFPVLHLVNDSGVCSLTGRDVAFDETASGHYTVPICKEMKVAEVFAVNMQSLSEEAALKKLSKLHSQFGHPAKQKLVGLMKNACCWSDEFHGLLDSIQSKCLICKQYSKTPPRPVVALPLATEFNQVVCMDLKKWDTKWILHLIDYHTRYTVSVFIDRKLATSVIDAIMVNWVSVFGVMRGWLTDNGGEFTSDESREVASILGIEVKTTAAESPWQNGLCERVHQVTDMILLKLKADYPRSRLSVLLKWANLARNSLQMYNGFSPHQLVFGQNPNLPDVMSVKLPSLDGFTTSVTFAEHLNALHAARRAYVQSESSERVRRALRHKIRASQQVFAPGERVFYKRDGREKWLGPGKVIFQDGKVVFVRHGSVYVKVSVNRLVKGDDCVSDDVTGQGNEEVVSAGRPSEHKIDLPADYVDAEYAVDAADTSLVGLDGDRNVDTDDTSHNTESEIVQVDRVISDAQVEADKLLHSSDAWIGSERRSTRIANKQLGFSSVYLTFVPREQLSSPEVLEAKAVELEKLKDFDTYEVVKDQGQSRISTRWVVTMKEGKPRARLVARGFEEKEQTQNDSPTIGKSSLRLFLTLTVSYHWKIKSTDIKSAFLQGREIERSVFITPPKEAGDSGDLWKLKKCLYGLTDASRQFYLSVRDCMLKLGCLQCVLDPSLYFKLSSDGSLIGVMVCHIDDFLHAGTSAFDKEVMDHLRTRFLAGRVVDTDFPYVGYQISQSSKGILVDQDHYVQTIEADYVPVSRSTEKKAALTSGELSSYRALIGSINWVVCGTRPDLYFELIDMSTKFRCASVEDWLRAKKVLRKLKEDPCAVFFPDIGPMNQVRLCAFTDAAYANLTDGVSSTAGYVVFAVGKDMACPLSWRSNKIKRVVRSTLAAEVLACLEGLEDCLYLRAMIMEILKVKVSVLAYVDSKSFKDNIHSTKLVDNKQLRIDIGTIRQMLSRNDVDAIRWCSGLSQLADCLTKRGASGQLLRTVFQTGKLIIED